MMAMSFRLDSTYKTHKVLAVGYHTDIYFKTEALILTDGGRWLLMVHR